MAEKKPLDDDLSDLGAVVIEDSSAAAPDDLSDLGATEVGAAQFIDSSPLNIQPDTSKTESFLRGAAQGASLGFQDELSPVLGALFPTETDVAQGRGFADRYRSIKATMQAENKLAQASNPTTFGLGSLTGSLPLSIAGGALAGPTVLAQAGVAGTQAGLQGFGESEASEISERLKQAAKSGLLSAGLSSALGGGLKLVKKAGNFFFEGADGAYQLGRKEAEYLGDRAVQRAITREFNQAPETAKVLLRSSRNHIGDQLEQVISPHADIPVNAKPALSKAYDLVNNLPTSAPGQKEAKEHLLKLVQSMDQSITDPVLNKTSSEAKLGLIQSIKKNFGREVYENRSFSGKDLGKHYKAADSLYKGLKEAINEADTLRGTGGQISKLNEAYSALHRMENNVFSGANLMGYVNTQAAAASKKVEGFKNIWMELNPQLRKELAPLLDDFISKDLDKVVAKGQLMKIVTGRDPGEADLIGKSASRVSRLFNLAGKGLTQTERGLNRFFEPTGVDIPLETIDQLVRGTTMGGISNLSNAMTQPSGFNSLR